MNQDYVNNQLWSCPALGMFRMVTVLILTELVSVCL